MLFFVKFGAIQICKKEHQYNINFHNLKKRFPLWALLIDKLKSLKIYDFEMNNNVNNSLKL